MKGGIAMYEANSRRPHTADTRVRSQASLFGTWNWIKWYRDRIFCEYFVLPHVSVIPLIRYTLLIHVVPTIYTVRK